MSGTGAKPAEEPVVVAPGPGEGTPSAATPAPAGTGEPASPSGEPVAGTPPVAAVDPAAGGEPEAPAAAAPGEAPVPAWLQKKFDRIYARLKDTERERDALRAAPAGGEAAQAAPSEAEINRRAAEIAENNRLAEQVKQGNELGRATYQDFDARVARVKELVADERDAAGYSALLRTAIETGQAHRIMYELGGNRERASELMELALTNPAKMAVEVAKMSLVQGEPEPSKAPRPITPISPGKGQTLTEIAPDDPAKADKLSTAEWMRRRQAQREAARGAR